MQNTAAPSALFTMTTEDPKVLNQYGDESFQIQDPMTGQFYSVSFAWNCSMAKRLYAQMYFLAGDISRGYAVRIPRHPATQSTLIWPGIPRPSGHLFHGHPAGQSERSDAGVALLV